MDHVADLVLDARNLTGEGPIWSVVEQALWWIDINGRNVHRLDPTSGRHDIHPSPGRVGCHGFRASGGLIYAMEHGIGFSDPVARRYDTFAEPEADILGNRFNDGRVDPRGRFLAGSMNDPPGPKTAALWRVDPDRRIVKMIDGAIVANGLAFSPDGRTMYFADSPTRTIFAYDYDLDDGVARNGRIFHHAADEALGQPDGAAVDSDGCLWSTRYHGGQVLRLTPDGRIDRVLRLPVKRATMCAFGGADLRALYVTSARFRMSDEDLAMQPLAGGLFAADVGATGMAEPSFAG